MHGRCYRCLPALHLLDWESYIPPLLYKEVRTWEVNAGSAKEKQGTSAMLPAWSTSVPDYGIFFFFWRCAVTSTIRSLNRYTVIYVHDEGLPSRSTRVALCVLQCSVSWVSAGWQPEPRRTPAARSLPFSRCSAGFARWWSSPHNCSKMTVGIRMCSLATTHSKEAKQVLTWWSWRHPSCWAAGQRYLDSAGHRGQKRWPVNLQTCGCGPPLYKLCKSIQITIELWIKCAVTL